MEAPGQLYGLKVQQMLWLLSFFLKNVHIEMRKSASNLFGSTEFLRSRPNVIGELLRELISPSPDVQNAVNSALSGGPDPHISVHMRMLMNRSIRAVTTVFNCIKTAIGGISRPRIVVVSGTPSLVSELMPKLHEFAEVLHFEYKKFKGNISGSGVIAASDVGFRAKDWGPAPRWVAFVDFFLGGDKYNNVFDSNTNFVFYSVCTASFNTCTVCCME